jgi:hypothetical protein
MPHRADADRRGGSIHLDMFQDLLLAEFVVADLTLDNPNVWYEIGVRHALRAGGAVLTFALRDRLPFDIAGQRMQRYTLREGRLDPDLIEAERNALKEAIEATLGAWRGRRASPVYQQLPTSQNRTGRPSKSATSTSSGRRSRRGRAGSRWRDASSGPATLSCSPEGPPRHRQHGRRDRRCYDDFPVGRGVLPLHLAHWDAISGLRPTPAIVISRSWQS